MADLEKVLRGWERCKKCSMSPIAPQEAHKAYYECEYTIGLYCGKDKLEYETIELLKEQDEEISNYKETIENLLQQLQDIGKYMTPYGMVKDVKAYADLLKEQEAEIERLKKPTAGDNQIPLRW